MLERIVAFATYRCNRCGRRESKPLEFTNRSEEYKIARLVPKIPEGWSCLIGLDFCPNCAAIIKEAMNPAK